MELINLIMKLTPNQEIQIVWEHSGAEIYRGSTWDFYQSHRKMIIFYEITLIEVLEDYIMRIEVKVND